MIEPTDIIWRLTQWIRDGLNSLEYYWEGVKSMYYLIQFWSWLKFQWEVNTGFVILIGILFAVNILWAITNLVIGSRLIEKSIEIEERIMEVEEQLKKEIKMEVDNEVV